MLHISLAKRIKGQYRFYSGGQKLETDIFYMAPVIIVILCVFIMFFPAIMLFFIDIMLTFAAEVVPTRRIG